MTIVMVGDYLKNASKNWNEPLIHTNSHEFTRIHTNKTFKTGTVGCSLAVPVNYNIFILSCAPASRGGGLPKIINS